MKKSKIIMISSTLLLSAFLAASSPTSQAEEVRSNPVSAVNKKPATPLPPATASQINQSNAVIQAGATLDGSLASAKYQTLEDLKKDFPHASSLSQTLDELALQKIVNETPVNGTVELPVGTLSVSNLSLTRGIVLQGAGDGDDSIIQQVGTNSGVIRGQSDSEDQTIDGIKLRNFKMQIPKNQRTFSEHAHLIRFDGVSNLEIDGCNFHGFHGDAVYIGGGTSTKAPDTRHNRNVTIKNSTFNGVNKENRNAVSIIDGTNVDISGNGFYHTTRPDMPGAIDVEPNANPASVVNGISIHDNHFEDIGGKLAVVGFACSAADFEQTPQNISVANNTVNSPSSTFFAFQTDTDGPNNINVANNLGNVGRMLNIMSKTSGDKGADGLVFEKNDFATSETSLIGSDDAQKGTSSQVDNVAIRENKIQATSNFNAPIFQFTRSSSVDFSSNTVTNAGGSAVLDFVTPQGISKLSVTNNTALESRTTSYISAVDNAIDPANYQQNGNTGLPADLTK